MDSRIRKLIRQVQLGDKDAIDSLITPLVATKARYLSEVRRSLSGEALDRVMFHFIQRILPEAGDSLLEDAPWSVSQIEDLIFAIALDPEHDLQVIRNFGYSYFGQVVLLTRWYLQWAEMSQRLGFQDDIPLQRHLASFPDEDAFWELEYYNSPRNVVAERRTWTSPEQQFRTVSALLNSGSLRDHPAWINKIINSVGAVKVVSDDDVYVWFAPNLEELERYWQDLQENQCQVCRQWLEMDDNLCDACAALW